MTAPEQQLGPAVPRTLLDYARGAAKYGKKLKAWHIIIEIETDEGDDTQICRAHNGFSRSALQTGLFNAALSLGLEALGVMRDPVELDSTPEDE